jgi:hypothetical protein
LRSKLNKEIEDMGLVPADGIFVEHILGQLKKVIYFKKLHIQYAVLISLSAYSVR